MLNRSIIVILAFFVLGCSKPINEVRFTQSEKNVSFSNLGVCDEGQKAATIDPQKPVTIFIHGCNSSGGLDFRALAQVFEFHGQQTLCFDYNDRDSMWKSSAELVYSLSQLSHHMGNTLLTVIGHSQGGLVARRALIEERKDGLRLPSGVKLRLTTISSPFAGIKNSEDCGKTYLHLVTLGITIGICRIIGGEKWNELYPGSEFMRYPGELTPEVHDYLKIVTDERNSCFKYDNTGECIEDDFVFSIQEQYHKDIDTDKRLNNIEIKAGHSEIVGNKDVAPKKLITILQEKNILKKTDAFKKDDLENLLSSLYKSSQQNH